MQNARLAQEQMRDEQQMLSSSVSPFAIRLSSSARFILNPFLPWAAPVPSLLLSTNIAGWHTSKQENTI